MTSSEAEHEWVSARAVAWVIHDAPVPADLAFTLTVIAARCDEHGRGSYQSVPTIAALTGRSVDQVRRDIRRLLDLGLLLLGDQARVEHLPAGQRPTVYDVPLHVRGPKPVKQSKNPSGKRKAPPGMDATPGMHAGGSDAPAGQREDDGLTPCIHATPCMDASPGMDATQTTMLNNPKNNPSLSGPIGRVMAAVDATVEETREIIAIIEKEHRPRSLVAYVATMAANGDLAAVLERVRAGGRAASSSTSTPPSYAELLAREPCPHGIPGGAEACALCRRGATPAAPAELVEVIPAEQARAAARAVLGDVAARRQAT